VGVGIRRDSIHRGYSSIGEAKSVGSSRIRRTRLDYSVCHSRSFFFQTKKCHSRSWPWPYLIKCFFSCFKQWHWLHCFPSTYICYLKIHCDPALLLKTMSHQRMKLDGRNCRVWEQKWDGNFEERAGTSSPSWAVWKSFTSQVKPKLGKFST